MAETAFQPDAFQNDAFQVIAVPVVVPVEHHGGKGPRRGPPHGAAVVVGPAQPRRIIRIDVAAEREAARLEAERLAEEEWLLILAIAEAA